MCWSRRTVRLLLPLAVIAALAIVATSRHRVETWHVVAGQTDGRDEGP
jgi:hypothetical protein